MNKELLLIQEVPFFEKDKHVDPQGIETWSARDLCQKFGYQSWDAFEKVIRAAQTASDLRNIDPRTQFRESTRLGTTRGEHDSIKDYELTRYACYLIAQHADSKNPRIAEAQMYFSLHTYRQEKLSGLTPDEQHLQLRMEASLENKRLAKIAKASGLDERHYGSFHDEGYLGLYRMPLRILKQKRGIESREGLLDRIGPLELTANILRISKTQEGLRDELAKSRIPGDARTQEIHNSVGARVRKAMEDIGGVLPENLPVTNGARDARRRNFEKISR
jgi:DNA-damage-inducible protein D